MQETREAQVWSLGWEDSLEQSLAAHSSTLAWRNLTDRGAWWATVHGVTESRNWLKQPTMHDPGEEGSLEENGYTYMHDWVPSLSTWDCQSIVNWLYSDTTWKAMRSWGIGWIANGNFCGLVPTAEHKNQYRKRAMEYPFLTAALEGTASWEPWGGRDQSQLRTPTGNSPTAGARGLSGPQIDRHSAQLVLGLGPEGRDGEQTAQSFPLGDSLEEIHCCKWLVMWEALEEINRTTQMQIRERCTYLW